MFKLDDHIKNNLLPAWCQGHQIDLCILFGSCASQTEHALSDIDIALYSQHKNLLDWKLRLVGELEEMIPGAPIDVVIIHRDMSLLLRHEILLKGKPLFISNRRIYDEQIMYAVKMYDDVSFLKKYQDIVLETKLRKLKDVSTNIKREIGKT
jgi:predicted nucleotidyltransferase